MAIPIIGAIVETIGGAVGGYFEHRKAKTDARREVELKRLHQLGEADVASASDMKTSWKDEYLVILFSIPLIVVFHAAVWGDPTDIDRVKEAFSAMNQLPEWYMWAITGIVAGTFGLRALSKRKP